MEEYFLPKLNTTTMAYKKLSKEAREEKQARKVMNGIIGTLVVLILGLLCYFFAMS